MSTLLLDGPEAVKVALREVHRSLTELRPYEEVAAAPDAAASLPEAAQPNAAEQIASALWGDTLAVGARGRGAVCVLRRTDTAWQQQAYLEASNTGAGDFFGWSVALSGDTLAVGARWEDSAATEINGNQASNAAWNSGAVYVFH